MDIHTFIFHARQLHSNIYKEDAPKKKREINDIYDKICATGFSGENDPVRLVLSEYQFYGDIFHPPVVKLMLERVITAYDRYFGASKDGAYTGPLE